jgi:hypothetical protein
MKPEACTPKTNTALFDTWFWVFAAHLVFSVASPLMLTACGLNPVIQASYCEIAKPLGQLTGFPLMSLMFIPKIGAVVAGGGFLSIALNSWIVSRALKYVWRYFTSPAQHQNG